VTGGSLSSHQAACVMQLAVYPEHCDEINVAGMRHLLRIKERRRAARAGQHASKASVRGSKAASYVFGTCVLEV
jgi:hypothetical protein